MAVNYGLSGRLTQYIDRVKPQCSRGGADIRIGSDMRTRQTTIFIAWLTTDSRMHCNGQVYRFRLQSSKIQSARTRMKETSTETSDLTLHFHSATGIVTCFTSATDEYSSSVDTGTRLFVQI